MPPRGPYKRSTPADRQRILDAYDNGDDAVAVGLRLGFKHSTIYSILSRGTANYGKRGGNKQPKVTQAIKDFLEDQLELTADITLVELAARVQTAYGIAISPQCVGKAIDGMAYTVKEVRAEVVNMNSEINKNKRFEYAQSILDRQGRGCRIIWMDESNVNIHCKRGRGRSLRGSRAIIQVTATRGANLHMLAGMTSMEILNFRTLRGAFRGPQLASWLKTLVQELPPGPDTVLVCDNAPVHSRIEEFLAEAVTEVHGDNPPFRLEILRLGPYSPMLNPIENVWSKAKSLIKSQLRERRQEIFANPPAGQTIADFRLGILEQAAVVAVDACRVPGELVSYVQSVNGHVANALQKLDMPLGV